MIRLWGVLRSQQRIIAQQTVQAVSPAQADVREAVREICRNFNIAAPMWMEKHDADMANFGRAVFLPEHFIEDVRFERFEIEILREKGRSRDPRNDFS